jgi:hypothetical protein
MEDLFSIKEGKDHSPKIYKTATPPKSPLNKKERDHFFNKHFSFFFKRFCFKMSSDANRLICKSAPYENNWDLTKGQFEGPHLGYAWELFNKVLDKFDKSLYKVESISYDDFFTGFAQKLLANHILDEKRSRYITTNKGNLERQILIIQKKLKENKVFDKIKINEELTEDEKSLYRDYIDAIDKVNSIHQLVNSAGGIERDYLTSFKELMDKLELNHLEISRGEEIDFTKVVKDTKLIHILNDYMDDISPECYRYVILRYVFDITKKDIQKEFSGKGDLASFKAIDNEYRQLLNRIRTTDK